MLRKELCQNRGHFHSARMYMEAGCLPCQTLRPGLGSRLWMGRVARHLYSGVVTKPDLLCCRQPTPTPSGVTRTAINSTSTWTCPVGAPDVLPSFNHVFTAMGDLPSKPETFWQQLAATILTAPYPQRYLLWWSAALAGGALLLVAQRRLAPGVPRLGLVLPLALFNTFLPFLFKAVEEQNTVVGCFIITGALSSLKALGWALNRGPLVQPLTTPQFLAAYALPITPLPPAKAPASTGRPSTPSSAYSSSDETQDSQAKTPVGKARAAAAAAGRGHPTAVGAGPTVLVSGGSPLESLCNFALKAVGLLAVSFVLLNWGGAIPRYPRSILMGMGLYCGLGGAMDLCSALVGGLLHLPLLPEFDNPYHTTTIASFWSKRWNATVSYAVRYLFYDPIVEGRLVRDERGPPAGKPTPARRAAGLCASFFLSGVLHEMLFWYLAGRPVWFHLAYFSMWAPIVLAEGVWRRLLRRQGIRVPTWVAWLTTITMLQLASDRLFWEPHYRLGTPQRALAVLERGAPWLKLKRD